MSMVALRRVQRSFPVATLAALTLAATAAAPARAAHTGLLIIPTAETVGAQTYLIEPQFDGTFPARRAETRVLNIEFGIGRRFETGVDFDLSEDAPTRLLLNAKYLLAPGGGDAPALAVGVTNVGRDVKSAPYLVVTHDFEISRVHLGTAHIEGRDRWFVGVDRALGERLTVLADYTSGADNFSSVGASYRHSERLELVAGTQIPNADEGDPLFTLHVVLTGRYR